MDFSIYQIPIITIAIGAIALIQANVLFVKTVIMSSLYFTQLTATRISPATAHPIKKRLITVHVVTI